MNRSWFLLLPFLLIPLDRASADPIPSGPTGVKPQSKTWFAHDHWWAAIGAKEGVFVWKFDGAKLQAQSAPGPLPRSKVSDACDVLATSDHLFILAHNEGGKQQRLYKLAWRDGAYHLLDGFPVEMPLGGETSTITQDSTGRLWVAVDRPKGNGRQIRVVWSEPKDHLRWNLTGMVLEEGVSSDDLCAITAFAGNRVGVFWSDQVRDRFGFRVHQDGKPPEAWEDLEVVVQEKDIADDHINLAVDGQGRVWAVTKDDRDKFTVWRRSEAGAWDLRVLVPQKTGTRPIIMVSDAKVHVAYTDWTQKPKRIAFRSSPLEKVAFGEQTTLITSPEAWNDVSGPKQMVEDAKGFLVVARSSAGEVRGVLVKP